MVVLLLWPSYDEHVCGAYRRLLNKLQGLQFVRPTPYNPSGNFCLRAVCRWRRQRDVRRKHHIDCLSKSGMYYDPMTVIEDAAAPIGSVHRRADGAALLCTSTFGLAPLQIRLSRFRVLAPSSDPKRALTILRISPRRL